MDSQEVELAVVVVLTDCEPHQAVQQGELGINSHISKMLRVLLISQNVGAAKKETCTVVDLTVLEAMRESRY